MKTVNSPAKELTLSLWDQKKNLNDNLVDPDDENTVLIKSFLKKPELELDESGLRGKVMRARDRDHLQTFPAERTDSDAGSFSGTSPVKSLGEGEGGKVGGKVVGGSESKKKGLWVSDGKRREFKLQYGFEKTYSSPKKVDPKPAEFWQMQLDPIQTGTDYLENPHISLYLENKAKRGTEGYQPYDLSDSEVPDAYHQSPKRVTTQSMAPGESPIGETGKSVPYGKSPKRDTTQSVKNVGGISTNYLVSSPGKSRGYGEVQDYMELSPSKRVLKPSGKDDDESKYKEWITMMRRAVGVHMIKSDIGIAVSESVDQGLRGLLHTDMNEVNKTIKDTLAGKYPDPKARQTIQPAKLARNPWVIHEEPGYETSPMFRNYKYKKAQTSVGGGFNDHLPVRSNLKVPQKPPKSTIVNYYDEDQAFVNLQRSKFTSEVSSGSIEHKRLPTESQLSINPTAVDSQDTLKAQVSLKPRAGRDKGALMFGKNLQTGAEQQGDFTRPEKPKHSTKVQPPSDNTLSGLDALSASSPPKSKRTSFSGNPLAEKVGILSKKIISLNLAPRSSRRKPVFDDEDEFDFDRPLKGPPSGPSYSIQDKKTILKSEILQKPSKENQAKENQPVTPKPRRMSNTMLAAKDLSKNDFMIKKEKTGNVVTKIEDEDFLSPSPAGREGKGPGWSAEKETPQFNVEGKMGMGVGVGRGRGGGEGGVKDPRFLDYDDESLDGDDL